MVNYMEVFGVLPQPCLLLEPAGSDFKVKNANRAFYESTSFQEERILDFTLDKLSDEFSLARSCKIKMHQTITSCYLNQQPVTLEPVKYTFKKASHPHQESYWSVKHIPVTCKISVEKTMYLAFLLISRHR